MQVSIKADVLTKFGEIKSRKGKGRWMIVKYEKNGNTSVEKYVEKEEKEDEDEAAQTFIDAVKAADPCWAFMEYQNTIFFASYITSKAPANLKMPMAFNRGKFKSSFDGIKVDMECTDPADVELKVFKSKIKKITAS